MGLEVEREMPRGGRRHVSVTVYLTPQEAELLDAVRGALASKTLGAQEHSRGTLIAALVRAEAERLRRDGDLPYRSLNALARAVNAVNADPPPAKRQGRPPQVPGATPSPGGRQGR